MSLANSLICALIAIVAVIRLNHLGHNSSYLRRVVLVMLAAGGFGIAMQPFEPELAQFWPEVLFYGGVLTSMVVRYYRPGLYEDRPGREVIEWPLKRKNRA